MTRVLFFLLKLGLVVAAAVWLSNRPGEVTIVWMGYDVRMTFAVLLVLVALVAVAVTALYTFWRAVVGIPHSFMLGRMSRRRRKGYMALTQGMAAVASGDARAALKFAHKADKLLQEPSMTLLLQAQAAQMNGDEIAAARYYGQMVAQPDVSVPGLRGLMAQSLRAGDLAQALSLARKAQITQPKAAWVLDALVELEARAGNWDAALKVLAQAVRYGALSDARARELRASFFIAQSQQVLQEDSGDIEGALRFAKRAHSVAPGFVPACAHYATLLLKARRERLAAKEIERTWRISPHPMLARLYADAADVGVTAVGQVKRFERLASSNPVSGESRLALARAALTAQLWGIARQQLDLLTGQIDGHNGAEICRLIAELEEKEKADNHTADAWRMRAESAPAVSMWHCSACQRSALEWSVFCTECGAPASLVWGLASSAFVSACTTVGVRSSGGLSGGGLESHAPIALIAKVGR